MPPFILGIPYDLDRPAPAPKKKKPRGQGHILGIPCSFGELLDERADSAGPLSGSWIGKRLGGVPARPSQVLAELD